MNTSGIASSLATLFGELVNGAETASYVLNGGDGGLLRSLDALDAAAASRVHGGSSIAAHVDHLRYGLSLMNRWAAGEKNPWKDADWTISWRKTTVTEPEWTDLRARLRDETARWAAALAQSRDAETIELTGMIASIVHLAYHVGAIRQMDRRAAGPSAIEARQ